GPARLPPPNIDTAHAGFNRVVPGAWLIALARETGQEIPSEFRAYRPNWAAISARNRSHDEKGGLALRREGRFLSIEALLVMRNSTPESGRCQYAHSIRIIGP